MECCGGDGLRSQEREALPRMAEGRAGGVRWGSKVELPEIFFKFYMHVIMNSDAIRGDKLLLHRFGSNV